MEIAPFKIQLQNAYESRIVQEICIANGLDWTRPDGIVKFTDEMFVSVTTYANGEKHLTYIMHVEFFKKHPAPEITFIEFVEKYCKL